jgi:hypothetical protein
LLDQTRSFLVNADEGGFGDVSALYVVRIRDARNAIV